MYKTKFISNANRIRKYFDYRECPNVINIDNREIIVKSPMGMSFTSNVVNFYTSELKRQLVNSNLTVTVELSPFDKDTLIVKVG